MAGNILQSYILGLQEMNMWCNVMCDFFVPTLLATLRLRRQLMGVPGWRARAACAISLGKHVGNHWCGVPLAILKKHEHFPRHHFDSVHAYLFASLFIRINVNVMHYLFVNCSHRNKGGCSHQLLVSAWSCHVHVRCRGRHRFAHHPGKPRLLLWMMILAALQRLDVHIT